MDKGGVGTGAVLAIVVGVVACVAIVVAGIYFITMPEKSKVELLFVPSSVNVGEDVTMIIRVTNEEADVMTITGATFNIFQDSELSSTEGEPPEPFSTTTIPAGETVTILEYTIPAPNPGIWTMEVVLETNYGTLRDSYTITVTGPAPG
jgi:uncharacterized protein (DUF58 family)